MTYLLMGWWGPGALAVVWPTTVCLLDFFCSNVWYCVMVGHCLCFITFFCFGLCVLRDDAWVSWGSFMQAGQQCVLVHIWAGGGVGSPWDPFEPSR